MNLANELINRINTKNVKIVKNLVEFICHQKYTSLEELQKYEDNIFKQDNRVLSKEEQIDYCLNLLETSPYDYDLLDYEEIQLYKKFIKIVKDDKSNMDNKIQALIVLYNITHREIYFPVETYNFIVNNNFNIL